jgi:hypothetical protein
MSRPSAACGVFLIMMALGQAVPAAKPSTDPANKVVEEVTRLTTVEWARVDAKLLRSPGRLGGAAELISA